MNMIDVFDRAAAWQPDSLCWADGSTGVTYMQARAIVDRLAGGLAGFSVSPGDRIALIAPDSVRLLALIVACWRVGAMPCLIDPRSAPHETRDLLDRIQPRLVVSAADVPWENGTVSIDDKKLTNGSPAKTQHSETSPLFCSTTSGTTGAPKLAVLQSGPVTSATASIADRINLRRNDVLIATTPTSSSFQLVSSVLPALHVGAAVVLMSGDGAAGAAAALADGLGTALVGYPLTLGDFAALSAPDGLRLALSGGSPLAPRLKVEYREQLGVPLVESYGMSELGGFVALGRPGESESPLRGAVGQPMPDRPVVIVDLDGQELGAGEPGEVTVTEGWMSGYLSDVEATTRATRGGVLHTSDVGVFDQDRNLMVLGRLSDQVPANVPEAYPRMWEDALHDHPDVLHAAVITTEQGHTGFVQSRPGRTVDATDVMSHLKKVSAYSALHAMVVLTQMPRTFSGKVDRRALAARSRGEGV